jgi:hypothetical protein
VKTAAIFLLTLFATPAFADSENNSNAWFMYFGDHPVAKSRWGVHLEGQWRRADLGATWQQLLLRPGVNYQASKSVLLTFGYGYIETHPYGSRPILATTPEHRVFEQLQYTRRIGKFDLANRFRLEQRHLGVLSPKPSGGYQANSFRYENRLRYMARTTLPLGKSKQYVALYDEIMFNFGKQVDRNVFDQNRAYVALGHNLGHETRAEFGFLEQTIQRRGGAFFEHNHTLQIAIYSRLPFGN